MGMTGDKVWLSRLRRVADAESALGDWAFAGAATIALEARNLVNEHGSPSPNHIVSAPYQPPNTDTGELQSKIQPVELPSRLEAAAVSSADYALNLEYGTANMLERPYMRVASANKKHAVVQDAIKRINRATRKR